MLLSLALQIAGLAFGVFAFIHAVRQRADAFPAVGKLTKPIWLGIIAASTFAILYFGLIFGQMSILGIAGVIAIGVYMADVRPKVDEIQQPRSW